MEMRRLGLRGPEISVVGFGAWEAGGSAWGPNASDAAVVDVIRAALDAGMNWIDTAEVYGQGRSEELVGRAVQGRRDEVLLFTKVAPDEAGSGLRPEQVRQAVEGSLARLGTDHVDLYQVHWPDPGVPPEETWEAMTELVEDGLVRHLGVSNFDRPMIERCLAVGPVDAVQNQLSLLHRDDAGELLPWLADNGIAYLGYGPLAFGLLTTAITTETTFDPEDWRSGSEPGDSLYREFFAPDSLPRHLSALERLRPVAGRLGVELPRLALAWALRQPGVTAVIAGSRNVEHVRADAAAGDLRLEESVVAEVERAIAG